MEEKKHDCEQHKSKRYLAFYIIGLFSVALVIILLSYLTQLRADRELANMNTALAQKDTTVLQQRMDERDAYSQLLAFEQAVAHEDHEAAQECIDYLEHTYGAGRLDGTADNAVFSDAMAERYLELKNQLA